MFAAAVIGVIALMMEATNTSENSVNFYQNARRYNPEESHLHTRRRENLKSYYILFSCSLIILSGLILSELLTASLKNHKNKIIIIYVFHITVVLAINISSVIKRSKVEQR
jgi:hypothetical protein